MVSDQINLIEMAAVLEKSPDYRVLRRLVSRTEFTPKNGQSTKIGILLDVETTGLDTSKHEVIELGMVKFAYRPDGAITSIIDVFECFNEPAGPIPEEISELNGITDAMVAGHRIDEDAVTSFVADAVVTIAHNAHFDRKFAERYWPIFERKAWACSATEVEWRKHGFDGSRLGYLLAGVGLFHQAHRAVDDCRALIEILASELPGTNKPALAALLDRARRKTMRIWAEQSPFDLKDELKKRGYTPWTIASVVGHKVEGGKIEGVALPLGMTMGRYAGDASWEAMTACVNAVALPNGTSIERQDLVTDLAGGRGLRRNRVPLHQHAAE
ncbi:MAG TPA: 3'-5' exonuclease [Edaphobacter sp.]|jgi:DNA polymerase-3 subunit epsilon|nr:3'-5' exonuclease [Edaphobacter sp.]